MQEIAVRGYEVRILNRKDEAVIKDSEYYLTDIAAISWGAPISEGNKVRGMARLE
jgi:hypothetical protein